MADDEKSKWRNGDFGLGLTNDGKPPVGDALRKPALAGGVLAVEPDIRLDEGLVIPPLSDGCVCTSPCVASGLCRCEFHHEADVDWSPVSLFESDKLKAEKWERIKDIVFRLSFEQIVYKQKTYGFGVALVIINYKKKAFWSILFVLARFLGGIKKNTRLPIYQQ